MLGAIRLRTCWYGLARIGNTNCETPRRSIRRNTPRHTRPQQGVVRDVEAGGSNPLTPTKFEPVAERHRLGGTEQILVDAAKVLELADFRVPTAHTATPQRTFGV